MVNFAHCLKYTWPQSTTMTLKLTILYFAVIIVALTNAAPKRNAEYRAIEARATNDDDVKEKRRLAAVLLKDEENGELRFLTGTGTSNNQAINQLITQKQNMLEQLRPNSGLGTGSGVFLTGSGTGLGTSLGTTGLFGSTGSSVTPIVVNLSGTTTGTNTNLANLASNVSPIGDILPQVIAQAVINGNTRRRPANRRVVNRRVVNSNNNRRRRRPTRTNQPKVVVVRP